MSVNREKQELRVRIKERLQALTPQERTERSTFICQSVIRFLEAEFPQVRLILSFSSMPDEVDTRMIMHWADTHAVALALPRISGTPASMSFHRLPFPASDQSLVRHPYGFYQPPADIPELACTAYDPTQCIMIVPGVAFDLHGGRLGHGGGFYDRYLGCCRSFLTPIGVCFAEQIVQAVPREAHDHPITELFRG
ncbi:MAG: 5-formyltetrahydrofolate cyclo-ligase [Spirochaetia bacterium]|nr:5-formyltetrahydrofolate cyclo-ligase [Spirochaetia bacterium]